jgi:prepilin peptidase CpaA
MDVVSVILLYLLVGLLAWASYEDARDYLIPNRICAAVAALFPIYVLTIGEWSTLWPSTFVAIGVLVVGFILFSRGLLGGGDVKLMVAVSLWAGPALVLPFVFITGIAGGLLSLAMIAPRLIAREGALLAGPPVPYGVAVAAGGLYVAFHLLAGI